MNNNAKNACNDIDNEEFYIIIMEILEQLFEFAENLQGNTIHKRTKRFLQDQKDNEDSDKLKGIYIWWCIFAEPVTKNEKTIYQLFFNKLLRKPMLSKNLLPILNTWKQTTPGFYIVSERISREWIVLEDCFSYSKKMVLIKDVMITPEIDDLVTGFILPFDNESYLSLSEMYIFPNHNKGEIMNLIRKTNIHTNAFMYPAILKKSFQT